MCAIHIELAFILHPRPDILHTHEILTRGCRLRNRKVVFYLGSKIPVLVINWALVVDLEVVAIAVPLSEIDALWFLG